MTSTGCGLAKVTTSTVKKIRAKLLSNGKVLVSVTTVMRTDKGHEYSSTEHFEIHRYEAETLLYDLHSIVETLRGVHRPAKRWRRLVEKVIG